MANFFDYIVKYIQLIKITDIIDIAIVAIIVYAIIKLLRDTRGVQLVKGLCFILAVFVLSDWLNLNVLNYLLSGLLQIGAFALVVIFQPELRNILERMGRFNVGNIIDLAGGDNEVGDLQQMIESVATAASNMSATRTGALMAIERQTRLGEFISTGTVLEANVTSRLLEQIFVPNTPLHDGAVIIRGSKVITAGCLLPLTANNNISMDLGTRHRAALGLSEISDAVIIVVSEETGKISIALNGSLTRNLSRETLIKALSKTLSKSTETSETIDKIKFWRNK